jgi:hypothetical protein
MRAEVHPAKQDEGDERDPGMASDLGSDEFKAVQARGVHLGYDALIDYVLSELDGLTDRF